MAGSDGGGPTVCQSVRRPTMFGPFVARGSAQPWTGLTLVAWIEEWAVISDEVATST